MSKPRYGRSYTGVLMASRGYEVVSHISRSPTLALGKAKCGVELAFVFGYQPVTPVCQRCKGGRDAKAR